MTPPHTPRTPQRPSTLRLALAAIAHATDRALWWLFDLLPPLGPDDESLTVPPPPKGEGREVWAVYWRATRLREAARERMWAAWHRKARNRVMVFGGLFIAFFGWCVGLPSHHAPDISLTRSWFAFVWTWTVSPALLVRYVWIEHRDAKRADARAEEIEREVAAEIENEVRQTVYGAKVREAEQ